ncbi:hypothetical protein A6V39_00405 [Candidatus Mycoplasma haematobovis]|uniref:Uncharacterized protein n=1 Tax=Candidatus Mycoplasma haematobovis TaxID=432608 RepID=A0A1A9QES5_9MOLU|nr:hypothetical protein [Candidatus Mycoplasma haematobovis]OAL10511.1 hypothetical protein A6V39_00405 [Candidatus Mycoplasma haematobovis]
MAIPKQALMVGAGTTTLAGGSVGVYFLAQDRTIGHRIVSEGETLISEKEDYQKVFKEFKDEKTLTDLISTSEKVINSGSSLQEGGEELKKWCDKNLNTPLNDPKAKDLITKAKKYCTKPPLTIKEKYLKKGKKLVTDWGARLTKISTGNTGGNQKLINDLKTKNSSIERLDSSTTQSATKALQDWCNDHIDKQLSENSIDSIWTKVDTRCLEE